MLDSEAGAPQAEARGLEAAVHLRGVRRALQAQARLRHTRRYAQGYYRYTPLLSHSLSLCLILTLSL